MQIKQKFDHFNRLVRGNELSWPTSDSEVITPQECKFLLLLVSGNAACSFGDNVHGYDEAFLGTERFYDSLLDRFDSDPDLVNALFHRVTIDDRTVDLFGELDSTWVRAITGKEDGDPVNCYAAFSEMVYEKISRDTWEWREYVYCVDFGMYLDGPISHIGWVEVDHITEGWPD